MSAEKQWTLSLLMERTAAFFQEKEIENARIDAELLMGELLKKRRIDLYMEHDRPMSRDEVDRYREMVRSRVAGMPVQRIIGEADFYSLRLGVGEGVFIPRPETELLVDRAIDYFKRNSGGEGKLAVDVCAGTGAVALAVAGNLPGVRIEAVDSSPEAVRCIEENIRRTGVGDRVKAVEADAAEHLAAGSGRVDLVVSNPPYITTEEMESLPVEVRDHDPRSALHGGTNGLDVYGTIVPAAAAALVPGGLILLEVSDTVAEGVGELILATGRFEEARIDLDYNGRRRVLSAALRKES